MWIDEAYLDAVIEQARIPPGSLPLGRLPPRPKLGVDEFAALDEAAWTDEQIADALGYSATVEKVATWRAEGTPTYWLARLPRLVEQLTGGSASARPCTSAR